MFVGLEVEMTCVGHPPVAFMQLCKTKSSAGARVQVTPGAAVEEKGDTFSGNRVYIVHLPSCEMESQLHSYLHLVPDGP